LRIEKKYYSIGEVSDMVGLKEHVLRFWEKEFDFLQPIKNNAGHRKYTVNDVTLIEKIKRLVYEEKYTISGAKKKLMENVEGVFEENENAEETYYTDDFGPFNFEQDEDDIAATISKISDIVDDAVNQTNFSKTPPLPHLKQVKGKSETVIPDSAYIVPIKKSELVNELFEILKLL
jgi:DNA-binding transcriptional MerR regulator